VAHVAAVGYMFRRLPARRPAAAAQYVQINRPQALFLEHSPGDLVARRNSKLARRAADHFQHRPDRPP